MVVYNSEELSLIQQFKGQQLDQIWSALPETRRRWKCHTCHTIFENKDLVDGKLCPECGEIYLQKMCPLDRLPSDEDYCRHEVSSGIAECPVCGQSICPECGKTHNVATISRVTGYLSNVEGWNLAKRAELKDRMRYNPLLIA